jgi:exonuclease VII small subunit
MRQMRRLMLSLLAALCCAPGSAATLSRLPAAPVPVLRGPLQASGLSFDLGATLLAAPLAAPALSPSLVLPQLQPTPQVQVQASPALTPAASELDLTVPAAAPSAGASLEHLVAFADNLSRLASASAEPRPALDDFWSGPQSGGLGSPAGPGRTDPLTAGLRSPAVEAQGPSHLATPRDADFVRLGSIVAAAQASPSGRKILQSALALTRKQGRPIQVRFHGLKGNLGEYDYFEHVLYLNHSYADGDARLAAATLVHELLHILQHAEGVPSEALEMELEAHVVTLQVLHDLGVPADREGSFSAAAERKLRRSPEAFEEWMAGQLPGKLRLNKGVAAAVADLEQERGEIEESIEDLEEADANGGTAQAKGRLAKAQQNLAAVRADIKALKSPSGRTAYRKLAARTQALMKSYHRALLQRH